MIDIEYHEVFGFESAIRGMRNPLNSWDKSDSYWDYPEYPDRFVIGPNDLDLMKRLAKAGSSHRKYLRMITVYVDITAPLYWWKEFDTYKVGTVANSCSTMHKIHGKEFLLEDFSTEHLTRGSIDALTHTIECLNDARDWYLKWDYMQEKDKVNFDPAIKCKKDLWWQLIQLLPSSYNQKRTVMLNYEVLANMYHDRKNHKLDEWVNFCKWIETLPYSELITGEEK